MCFEKQKVTLGGIMKFIGSMITIGSIVVGIVMYIVGLKEENYNIRIESVKTENTTLQNTIKSVDTRLNAIMMMLNDNNSTIKLLSDKVERLEKHQDKLEDKVYNN